MKIRRDARVVNLQGLRIARGYRATTMRTQLKGWDDFTHEKVGGVGE